MYLCHARILDHCDIRGNTSHQSCSTVNLHTTILLVVCGRVHKGGLLGPTNNHALLISQNIILFYYLISPVLAFRFFHKLMVVIPGRNGNYFMLDRTFCQEPIQCTLNSNFFKWWRYCSKARPNYFESIIQSAKKI